MRASRYGCLVAAGLTLVLSGCSGGGGGGGGGGTPPAPGPAVLSGTAASGAPLSGAAITVLDGNGGSRTTTADANGAYSIDATNMAAPLVIRAEGTAGEAQVTLISVQPSVQAATVNVTPLTNAIAGTLASTGQPVDLITNIATEKANVSAERVSASEQAFSDALAAVKQAVGASGSLISAPLTPGNAMDKVLDIVSVEVRPGGEIVMNTTAGSQADDQGNTATTPAEAKSVVLAPGVLPTAGAQANLPAPAPADLVSTSDFEALRAALNGCFAVPAPDRGTFAAPHPSCAGVATADYLHEGSNGSQSFDSLLADATMNNAAVALPEIVRVLATGKILVKLPFLRTNGFRGAVGTVVERQPGGTWLMRGNQRQFNTFVNGYARARESTNISASRLATRRDTGINIFVRNLAGTFALDASITAVTVRGPGLPGFVDWTTPGAGVPLSKVPGCDFWSLNATRCGSLYAMQMFDKDGTKVNFNDPDVTLNQALQSFMANPQLNDPMTSSIRPWALYRFDLTVGGSVVTYWNRLRSRPLTSTEITTQVRFLAFSAATKDLVRSGSATEYLGGGKPLVQWSNPNFAAPAATASFLHNTFSDSISVRPSDLSAQIPCAGNPNCAGGGDYINAMNFGSPGSVTRLFQTMSRNRFDAQIFNQVSQ